MEYAPYPRLVNLVPSLQTTEKSFEDMLIIYYSSSEQMNVQSLLTHKTEVGQPIYLLGVVVIVKVGELCGILD